MYRYITNKNEMAVLFLVLQKILQYFNPGHLYSTLDTWGKGCSNWEINMNPKLIIFWFSFCFQTKCNDILGKITLICLQRENIFRYFFICNGRGRVAVVPITVYWHSSDMYASWSVFVCVWERGGGERLSWKQLDDIL